MRSDSDLLGPFMAACIMVGIFIAVRALGWLAAVHEFMVGAH